MLITVAQRFLFDKIFVNYLLPNLSKYYDVVMQKDVERLIDMLKLFNCNNLKLFVKIKYSNYI